jgi:hypothetical protein
MSSDKISKVELRVFDNLKESKAATVMIESSATHTPFQKESKKLPVLIVCYLRPRNLEILLNNPEFSERRIYILIDRCTTSEFALNEEVHRVANHFRTFLDIEILRPLENLGVGRGVPTAIDWISSIENEFIILEDDCIPIQKTLNWFDEKISDLDSNLLLISGYSPASIARESDQIDGILCKYPMIWGWATSSNAWKFLRPKQYSCWQLLQAFIKAERKNRLSIAFFIAAQIRVSKGKLHAWDSPLALNMLIGGYKSLIPSKSLINNVGDDSVASHTQLNQNEIDNGNEAKTIVLPDELERLIESQNYKLKKRHFMAPIRAILNL